jgi:addiction module RelB/DinJ family antitoxin
MRRKGDTVMTATNISICAGSELEAKAQSVLANLGLDLPTAINMFLTQVVDKESLPFEVEETKVAQKKRPRSETFGRLKGKIWMADDFDAPLEEMREYME